MTAAEQAGAQSTADERAQHWRRRKPFGGHVAAAVGRLQEQYVRRKPTAGAVAALARLRAAVGKSPGSDYAVLAETSVPDDYLGWLGPDPTDTEHAKHAALTLYAVHQQSIHDKHMHVDGPGLGAAVRELVDDADRHGGSTEAVRRRFAALGTATTYDEAVYHLRMLVRQLRDKKISLDYGLLADDLVALRGAGGADRVRGWWGRELYRMRRADATNHIPHARNSSTSQQQTEE